MNIVITCPRYFSEIEHLKSKLSDDFQLDYFAPIDQGFSANEMKDKLSNATIAIIGDDEINDNVLSNSYDLKLLIKWGVGTDNIDIESKDTYPNLQIFNSPADIYIDVAEHVIFLIGSLYKKIPTIHNHIREQDKWSKPIGTRLYGKNIGIIGYGSIGKQVSKLLNSFETDVYFHDPEVENNHVQYAEKKNLEYIQKNSEVIIISASLNSQTNQLINKKFFDSLGKIPILVNVSRGKIINENDLVSALEDQQLLGCALDVFEEEPISLKSDLKNFENVILSSHNASNTQEANNSVNSQVTEILLKWFNDA